MIGHDVLHDGTHIVCVYFNTDPLALLNGYSPGDSLVASALDPRAYTATSAKDAANQAWLDLNDDERPNWDSERSLSVGDVLRVQGHGEIVWLACALVDWDVIDLPEKVTA